MMSVNAPLPIQAPIEYPWLSDQGNGTYRNPVLSADYSDPDVIRHGDDFYLVASSFHCTPGLPILHSRDLVNWTLINHALKNLPCPRYNDFQSGQGVWAPAIRYHNGQFWIFFPLPEEGIFLTTAVDPAGEWSEPHLVQPGHGLIDPCPLWDDDEKAYLVYAYAHTRAGIKDKLRISPMAPDGSRLLGEGKIVYDGSKRQPTIEGPKFLKREGWYYIFAPAGGVDTGWQAALRSRSIYGPYEDRVVLEQGSTAINGPHQGAFLDTPNGDWWFLHFQDAGVYGRISHLQPVIWADGWPQIGQDYDGNGIGEPVAAWRKPNMGIEVLPAAPATSDTFPVPRLGLQWQWNANHRDDWHSLSARPGYLRLFSQPDVQQGLNQVANLLLQKFPARAFSVETALEFSSIHIGERAGLIVTGYAHAAFCLRQGPTGWELTYIVDGREQAVHAVSQAAVRLRVDVADGGLCTFSYTEFSHAEANGKYLTVGEPFRASRGQWLGARIGLFSSTPEAGSPAGFADFRHFLFHPPAQ